METIEERAKEFANARWPKENFKFNDRYRREHYQKSRDTYIQIATEQKKIDIDKACEWLEMNLEYWLCDDDSHIIPEMIKDFRKAMEENSNGK